MHPNLFFSKNLIPMDTNKMNPNFVKFWMCAKMLWANHLYSLDLYSLRAISAFTSKHSSSKQLLYSSV